MTTVRKWGVQLGGADAGSWVVAEYECDGLERALLCDSPIRAARIASAWGLSTVRSVLVTQEEAGWALGDPLKGVSLAPVDCVVVVRIHEREVYLARLGHTAQIEVAEKFLSSREAYRRVIESYAGADYTVHATTRTSPRETRVAGRTLDELLASVPVEANHDD